MTHKCDVPRCNVLIEDGCLMCAKHWQLVPAPIRRSVNSTWRSIRAAKTTRTRGEAVNAYRKSVAEAAAALRKLEPLL